MFFSLKHHDFFSFILFIEGIGHLYKLLLQASQSLLQLINVRLLLLVLFNLFFFYDLTCLDCTFGFEHIIEQVLDILSELILLNVCSFESFNLFVEFVEFLCKVSLMWSWLNLILLDEMLSLSAIS
jgi:hypothetical protein